METIYILMENSSIEEMQVPIDISQDEIIKLIHDKFGKNNWMAFDWDKNKLY
jgi:hypothetical protein